MPESNMYSGRVNLSGLVEFDGFMFTCRLCGRKFTTIERVYWHLAYSHENALAGRLAWGRVIK